MWRANVGIQVSRREFHTYIHLDYVRIEILSYKKKKKKFFFFVIHFYHSNKLQIVPGDTEFEGISVVSISQNKWYIDIL